MSAPYNDRAFASGRREARSPILIAAACLAACLAGCGASAPTRPDAPPDVAADEPASAAALAAYAEALEAMRRDDRVEAELRLDELMTQHPHLPGPFVNAAILYRLDGRDDAARSALEQALALDAGHREANNELGILLREAGEFAAAEAAYRRALTTDPAYPPALYNLGVLLDVYLHRRVEALEYYEAYQAARGAPDEGVARWIVELRRRTEREAERIARRDAP